MDKKLREITNLGVEMMNSKWQVKRKLVGSRGTTTRLPFDINMIHKPNAQLPMTHYQSNPYWGYYMAARRYEISFLELKNISLVRALCII